MGLLTPCAAPGAGPPGIALELRPVSVLWAGDGQTPRATGPAERVGGRPTDPGRQVWMDVLRGIALLLVVLTHTLAQLDRHHGIDPGALALLSDTLAPVRIPTLMFLSGMLLERSLAKGPRRFLDGKVRQIAHPYVVWSLLYLLVWRLFPTLDGMVHDRASVLRIPVEPMSVLWYLHHLMAFYLVVLVLQRLPRWTLVVAALGLAAVAGGDHPLWERPLTLFAFFVAGDLVARHLDGGLHLYRDRRVVACCAVLASPLVLLAATEESEARYFVGALPFAVTGLVVLAATAVRLERTRAATPLAWLGRQSLVVYVTHWLLVSAAIAALSGVPGLLDHGVLMVAAVFVAVVTACCLAALAQQRSATFSLLFALPPRSTAVRRDGVSARG